MNKPIGKTWQEQETLDEMDEYLGGDWSPESLSALGEDLDRIMERARLIQQGQEERNG